MPCAHCTSQPLATFAVAAPYRALRTLAADFTSAPPTRGRESVDSRWFGIGRLWTCGRLDRNSINHHQSGQRRLPAMSTTTSLGDRAVAMVTNGPSSPPNSAVTQRPFLSPISRRPTSRNRLNYLMLADACSLPPNRLRVAQRVDDWLDAASAAQRRSRDQRAITLADVTKEDHSGCAFDCPSRIKSALIGRGRSWLRKKNKRY